MRLPSFPRISTSCSRTKSSASAIECGKKASASRHCSRRWTLCRAPNPSTTRTFSARHVVLLVRFRGLVGCWLLVGWWVCWLRVVRSLLPLTYRKQHVRKKTFSERALLFAIYVRQVDTFDSAAVFAYVSSGHYQMLLAHSKHFGDEDAIRAFLMQVGGCVARGLRQCMHDCRLFWRLNSGRWRPGGRRLFATSARRVCDQWSSLVPFVVLSETTTMHEQQQ